MDAKGETRGFDRGVSVVAFPTAGAVALSFTSGSTEARERSGRARGDSALARERISSSFQLAGGASDVVATTEGLATAGTGLGTRGISHCGATRETTGRTSAPARPSVATSWRTAADRRKSAETASAVSARRTVALKAMSRAKRTAATTTSSI